MVRVYHGDFRITREEIERAFRSHGVILSEGESERIGSSLELMEMKSSKGTEILSLGVWPSLSRALDDFSPRRPIAASILSCFQNNDFIVLSDERKKTMELYVRRPFGAEIYRLSHSQEAPWAQGDILFRDDFETYFHEKAARLAPSSDLPPNLFRAAEALSETFPPSFQTMESS